MSKTILLGFPKSGTSSFQELLTQLGRRSAHWRYKGRYIGSWIFQNKTQKMPLLTGLDGLDDITQMDVCVDEDNSYWPQLTDFKQLYIENPDTIFILNKRDPYKILKSMKNWFNRGVSFNERMLKYNPELFTGVEGGTGEEKIINLIEGHYKQVEEFFLTVPPAHFISFDIEKDGTEKLRPIDNAIGNAPFPKSKERRHVYND